MIDVREIRITARPLKRRSPAHASSWLTSLAIHGAAFGAVLASASWFRPARIAARPGGIGLQAALAAPQGDPNGQPGEHVELISPIPVSTVVVSPREATINDQRFVVHSAPSRPASLHETLTAVDVAPASDPMPRSEAIPMPSTAPLVFGLPRKHAFPHVDGAAEVNSLPSSSGAKGDKDPSFNGNAPPIYPQAAILAGWEGEVLLRVQIASSGAVEHVEVARSSGHEILDGAAVNAVSRWRGQPAYSGGLPVQTVEVLPVRFQLRPSE